VPYHPLTAIWWEKACEEIDAVPLLSGLRSSGDGQLEYFEWLTHLCNENILSLKILFGGSSEIAI
jgi:hypothetical protein